MQLCGFEIGGDAPLFVIAGPCALESRGLALDVAGRLREICAELNLPLIFKSSFDKANRTAAAAPRGMGIAEGLKALAEVRAQIGTPVTTDVHLPAQAEEVAAVADVLQIPAFLCRQSDLIGACAATGRALNIKKGQFLSPAEMVQVAAKARAFGAEKILLCERGASFGYNNLVADMRALVQMRAANCPIVFDATHSAQLPGAAGAASGGMREMVAPLARAAVAVGVDGVFIETHPDPERAASDAATQYPLDQIGGLLANLRAIRAAAKPEAAGG